MSIALFPERIFPTRIDFGTIPLKMKSDWNLVSEYINMVTMRRTLFLRARARKRVRTTTEVELLRRVRRKRT